MNIKVCGITEMKQLQQLDGLDIDFAGLIFYKESPRYIGDKISKKELKSAEIRVHSASASESDRMLPQRNPRLNPRQPKPKTRN